MVSDVTLHPYKMGLELSCDKGGIMTEIIDAAYGSSYDQPPFTFTEGAGACAKTIIPKGNMCGVKSDDFKSKLADLCLGKQSCTVDKERLHQMYPVNPCPGEPLNMTAIVQCRMSRIPFDAKSIPAQGEFGFLHFEERRFRGTEMKYALKSTHLMRLAFQIAKPVMDVRRPDNFTDHVWGKRDVVAHGVLYARRYLATFTVDKDMGAGGPLYWKFNAKSEGGVAWMDGGFLSIMDVGMSEEFCVDCRLEDKCGGDECVFQAHLTGGQTYIFALYALSSQERSGAKISIGFKPPATCVLLVGCEDPAENTCHAIQYRDLEFQPITKGDMGAFECRSPFNAQIVKTEVSNKNFCLDGSLYNGDVAACWPDTEQSSAGVGAGCAGTYAVTNPAVASVDGAWLAREDVADVHDPFSGAAVSISTEKGGGCSLTAAAGNLSVAESRVAFLRFEEGPCAISRTDAAKGIDHTKDLHKLVCTAATFAGKAGVAYIFQTAVRLKDVTSEPGVVAQNGRLKRETDGAFMKMPGHSGLFYADFGPEISHKAEDEESSGSGMTDKHGSVKATAEAEGEDIRKDFSEIEGNRNATLITVELPEIEEPYKLKPGFGRAGAVSMWFRKHSGNIPRRGEALFSFIPKGAFGNRVKVDNSGMQANMMRVLLLPDGILRFESDSAQAGELLRHGGFEEPRAHRVS